MNMLDYHLKILRPEKSNLRSPAIISDLNNSNKPEAQVPVLSPRPILSHKNSFTIEHGNSLVTYPFTLHQIRLLLCVVLQS